MNPFRRRGLRKLLRESVPLGVVIVLVLAARSSLADHYWVPTGSMEYTLLPGDRVFVDKTAYGLRAPFVGWELLEGRSPSRGEVVVFDSPESGDRLVKRVVGVGGDVVSIRGGRLFVNGRSVALRQPPGTEKLGQRRFRLNLSRGGGPDLGPIRIPHGQVLVVGDFRGNSRDGRMFGWIAERDVYGRAIAVYHRRDAGFLWISL